jgi:hypothetical protein
MRTVLPLWAALVLTAAPCRADDAVARLVERLGSDDHGEREAATEALAGQGAAAVPALRAALDSPDAEVRRRAAVALARIEERLEAEEVLRPRTVRLSYRDVPLAEALADFGRRTGLRARLRDGQGGLADRRISLDTGEVPFWDAYERLLDHAGLTQAETPHEPRPERRPGHKLVILDSHPEAPAEAPLELIEGREGPSFRAGSLRVQAVLPRAGAGAAVGDWPLTLAVTADPRPVWEGLVRLRLERVLDAAGRPLEHGGGVVLPAFVPPQWLRDDEAPPDPHRVTVPVRLGADAGACLKEVRGVVGVRLRVPDAELARLDARAGASAPGRDGSTVQVREVTHDGAGLWKVRLRLTMPPEPPPPPGVIVVRINQGPQRVLLDRGDDASIALLDAAGRRVALASGEYLANADDTVRDYVLSYQATPEQSLATLVRSGPRSVFVEVPFVLTDVPLRSK